MRHSVPGTAVVSCHLEQPLDDASWARFDELRRRRPGGLAPIALIRPPDPDFGEDEERWLRRARTLDVVGLHTHWTSPTHARPTGGDPAGRVRRDAEWMRAHGIEPAFFCGGGWYTDEGVRAVVRDLGLVDCTPREGVPSPGVLPTTHSVGRLARAVLRPLPQYVHAYFHDYDLLDTTRRLALVTGLSLLGRRMEPGDALALAR
jgi:hypothetical protein